ncbi:uncharacterized protein LOC110808197 [Carica papaya]|uniref:uncharacterized protein LOC110808197 n=1 Tax=Carica papaya TaxID=3649 RepID=UPI000B8CFAC6|nr:uncharacterized protein LOC110808197 [Carica papaya]
MAPDSAPSHQVSLSNLNCTQGGKNHGDRPCMSGGRGCYRCGNTQHFVWDYPLPREPGRPLVQGRMFAMTVPEAATTSEVIQGILYISNIPTRVLVDPSATHLFVSLRFASRIGREPWVLDWVLLIATPTNGALCTDVMFNSCSVEVEGRKFKVDLILLDIKDFGVILRMDWLAAQHAHVDCFRKRVVFKIPNKKTFFCMGKVNE